MLISSALQLERLVISYNQIRTLPETIGKLSKLKTLDVTGNKIKLVHPVIGRLGTLDHFDLSYNPRTSFYFF